MNDHIDATKNTRVSWMREATPYIRAHRDQTFVVYLGGDALAGPRCVSIVQDLLLLRSLGVKLVIVHGARPQIEQQLRRHEIEPRFVGDIRVTDEGTLECVKHAVAETRINFEALMSQAALQGSSKSNVTVVGGNFVVAKPAGVIGGIDSQFTGEIRRIDRDAISRGLVNDEIILLSPLGYSPTGEVFNLNALDLASTIASELNAAKFIVFSEGAIVTEDDGTIVRQLTVTQARERGHTCPEHEHILTSAVRACQFGVARIHLVDHTTDGVLIEELFTRDGAGTLISTVPFDHLHTATIEDVGGILSLIEPMEDDGSLVKRSREKLEIEIDHFSVVVREGIVVACGALYPFDQSVGELACIAVHPEYRGAGFGDALLKALERRAAEGDIERTFVLTTQATQWFQERGYVPADYTELPVERQTMYNFQRNSKVLVKQL